MPDRRQLIIGGIGAMALSAWPAGLGRAASDPAVMMRAIPSSGEKIPAVGLGSWITFNVGNDPELLDSSAGVMKAFFAHGGKLIDSSPMYGSSQDTIGYGLNKLSAKADVFSADKVWTGDASEGPEQIEASRRHWGVDRFDLLQVHNLVSWQAHLDTLLDMKQAGRLRYAGVSTSHGRRHDELETIMREQPIDFVQLTYNIEDRDVEQRLLPLAQERGIAVIVNRPYQRKALVRAVEGKPLPGWVEETGARSWAQFLLRFVISHPAVTCAIPATTREDHVIENMAAAHGEMPDQKVRARMAQYFRDL
ncbi:MAG: aldo/keto reductase [Anderseniella sp.]|nr:aldo/keto reductase [Anderseniella sp.]